MFCVSRSLIAYPRIRVSAYPANSCSFGPSVSLPLILVSPHIQPIHVASTPGSLQGIFVSAYPANFGIIFDVAGYSAILGIIFDVAGYSAVKPQRELALGSSCVVKAKWPPRCTCVATRAGVADRCYPSTNFTRGQGLSRSSFDASTCANVVSSSSDHVLFFFEH